MGGDPDYRTIVKIIATRQTRELWALLKIFVWVILIPMGVIGLAQLKLCRNKVPGISVGDCFRGRP